MYFEITSIIDVESNKNIPEVKATFRSISASILEMFVLSV